MKLFYGILTHNMDSNIQLLAYSNLTATEQQIVLCVLDLHKKEFSYLKCRFEKLTNGYMIK